MPPTLEGVEQDSTSRPQEKSSTTTRKDLAADPTLRSSLRSTSRLNLALDQKNALVRAIVYAEILGKPIGLKSKGGYELP